MANPFTTPTISNYNTSPPSDDGSATAANEITWAKHKTKLTDPVKTFVDSVSTNITTAFTRIFPFQTGAITATYTLQASDRGKMLTCSNTFTLTLLPAATAAANFVFGVKNVGSGTITIDGDGSETIDGATTVTLTDRYDSVTLLCDGSNWHIVSNKAGGSFTLNHLSGLTMSNGTDASHDIDIAIGEARDSADAVNIELQSALTKQIDATWAAGSAAGGLASSLTAPGNNTWYHVHLIVVGGAADVGFDTSLTAANLVSDHSATAYRRIGSVLTDGSANIIAFSQFGDEFLWSVPVQDFATTNPGTSAVSQALTVPPDVQVMAKTTYFLVDETASNTTFLLVTAQDQADTAPSSTLFDVKLIASAPYQGFHKPILTDTSKQIRYRLDETAADITVWGHTFGWTDSRGKT